MLPKKIFLIFFILSFSFVFSQQSFNLSGKIKSGNAYLSEVLLELQIQKKSKFAVTSTEGVYFFNSINCKLNDTLLLKVNYLGHKPFEKTIIFNQANMVLDIELETEAVELNEVVVKANEKNIQTASKSSYKVNQKKYIKNAKATDVLSTIPNVYCNKESGKITVEGNLEGKIFIDGIEAMPSEIKKIAATTIDRVEVISNPTSAYGTDFLGAIVNIVTKKTNKQFFKGSVSSVAGFVTDFWSVSPSLSYKKGFFSIKSDFQYLQNKQIISDDITRNDINGYSVQNYTKNSNVFQNYINTKIGLKFSEKSDLTITAYDGGYGFKGNMNGTTSLNDATPDSFKSSYNLTNNNIIVASVYKQKIGETKTLFLKNRFAIIKDRDESEYLYQGVNYFDVASKREELSFGANYNVGNLKIFKKATNVIYDLKYINRKYSFSNTDFYVNQNIFNATIETNNDWSKNFSTQFALTLENATNKSALFSKNNNLILPTFNAVYRFKNKINLRIGFSKKVLRPNTTDLNEALIIYSPGNATQGNSNLNQQIRNYYSLKINKEFTEDSFSMKLYRASINNSIVNVYKKVGDLLINTFDNVAISNSTGVDFDYSTTLFKKINLNINSGMNYNEYETNSLTSVIKKNNGTSFNNSINLSSNLFKDKVSVTFSGMYNGPDYTLLSKSITYPFLDFTIETNFFKEKLGFSLYLQNLLGRNATGSKDISFAENFQQTHVSKDNSTNVLLTLTYNFGKEFNAKIDDNTIKNEDVRK